MRTRRGIGFVVAAAMTWGTWSVFVRPASVSVLVSAPIVFAIMGLAALPLAWRESKARWDRTTAWLLVGNTLFDALNVVTFFAAIQNTTLAIAVMTHYAAPVIIAIAAPRIDKVRVRGAIPAALVALIGLAIVLEPWRGGLTDGTRDALVGGALGLASAFCYAGNVFVVRRLAERIGNGRALAFHSILAAIVLAPFAWLDGDGLRGIASLGWLAMGAVLCGTAAGYIYIIGLRETGSARAGVLAFAEPIVAVVVGALVWHEAIHPAAAIGGVLVLAAGIHVARQAR